MTIPSTALRALKRKQREGFHELDAAIESLEAEIRKSKASKRAVHAALPRPEVAGRTKAAKKDEARARLDCLAAIRVELHRETGGMCVVCGLGLPFARMHAHHILSGPERQAEERQETMAPVHSKCHDWLHGKAAPLDQRDALVALMAWCEATGREAAIKSTRHRIEKIDEARRG